MEGEAFLRAISAAPNDNTVRLVYADWLEERGDPRSEFVRIQVQVRETARTDESFFGLQAREQEVRSRCPAHWVARLDPPVWCVVGNVIDVRTPFLSEESVRGTRLFRPNAKIYLATRSHWYAVLDPERYSSESVQVLGQHRKSRQWLLCWVGIRLTINWRLKLIHDPIVVVRLREAGWPGFWIRENEFQCPSDRGEMESIRGFFELAWSVVDRPT
ncbi:TIGR02996 domain-containing protein [Limnoglobus roseus]|uniref:TIGR02996 domain-containing protein n=1 Tax=Limnoglobus roseus TaxID=2598579 RepID=A0A5C1A8U0_9BACT|nr:TIGR02996 domain-containing protein [Limnoglobus roseus]QEL14613.1 TIGR02996 domain-containing protein [Limnoglobus roseus]